MKRNLTLCLLLLLLPLTVCRAASSSAKEAKEVRAIIAKVNDYWQKNNFVW